MIFLILVFDGLPKIIKRGAYRTHESTDEVQRFQGSHPCDKNAE